MNHPTNIIDDLRLIEPSNPWILVWVVAGLVALGAIAVLIWRRRAVGGAQQSQVVSAHAHEDALAELEKARALMTTGNSRAYSIEVSRVVRHYIERRFSIVAPRRSTEEFIIEAATSVRLEKRHQELLRGFLSSCDFLKFARGLAEVHELEAMHQSAVRFVTDTRVATLPVPVEPVR